ncbi:MAG: BREX-1 system adenine-specific DNA-methyltransferase PglX [Prevotella sp.]
MDTNKLKRFAGEARNILIDGVKQRLSALGIREDGTIAEKPELKDGGAVFMGDTQTVDFYDQFESLSNQLKNHSYCDVIEEVAYTWFNRLVAIRIMAKNGLIPPVLEYESEQDRIPVLVSDARQGRMPQMNEESRQKLEVLLANDALTDEQFLVLIVAYCHGNPIINNCFGTISDYTELLLPGNILKKDGFIDRLNDDDYISDSDYKSPELIGWLYQFYISERKDEVFAKKGKFEADEIPAATQIFTPNWIVKYMVQNTVGRIYLDNNPYSDIKKGMQYLVEPAKQTPADAIYHFDDIHDLTCADLACGSGHILNECFDLLYQIYIEEGYNRRKAIENIFRYNLTGVDIDTRAKQLATFALLLKACQKDISFVDAHCMPRVLDMPHCNLHIWEDLKGHLCCALGLSCVSEKINKGLDDAFQLLGDADTLGSIMKFDINEETRTFMMNCIKEQTKQHEHKDNFRDLFAGFEMILTLTNKYSALVMNPPYMGGGNMNNVLSKYVKNNYEEGKADLATVFVQHMAKMTYKHGKYGFIIPPSWMFLSTFERLRKDIIDNRSIDSLLHLSRGVFGADFGASSVVISNTKSENAKGTYFRLIERTFQEFDQKHLQQLFEKTLANHDFKYYFKEYSKDVLELPYSDKGNKIYYSNVQQKNFEKIPGTPIGYWVNDTYRDVFKRCKELSNVHDVKKGIDAGKNERFLRLWHEVSLCKFSVGDYQKKWFTYIKGGDFKRWYVFYTPKFDNV